MTLPLMDQPSVFAIECLIALVMTAKNLSHAMRSFHVSSQISMCPCAGVLFLGAEVAG